MGRAARSTSTLYVPAMSIPTAFDQAADLVELARQRASARGLDNVVFHCADARTFQFDSEQFDLAHCRYVLSYLPDAADVVRRVFGALKPGGIFFAGKLEALHDVVGDRPLLDPEHVTFLGLVTPDFHR